MILIMLIDLSKINRLTKMLKIININQNCFPFIKVNKILSSDFIMYYYIE